jgi:hypothetical protein
MGLPRTSTLHSLVLVALFGAQAWAAAPTIVSLSPASGAGQTQTFTLTASDTAGAADIASIDMLINNAFNSAHACWIYYDHIGNRIQLASDAGEWNAASFGPGQTPGPSNSQCSVELISSSDAGNTVSVSIQVTFNGAWLGERTIWGESLDLAKNDSMYQQMGTWTATSNGSAQDFTVSITPIQRSMSPGQSVDYNVLITSVNGFAGTLYLKSSYSPDPGLLVIREKLNSPTGYYVPANGVNSRTITVSSSTSTTPTDDINFAFTYTDNNLTHTVPVTLTIAVPTIEVTPTSGSGSTQTFRLSVSNSGGNREVNNINFLINSTLNGSHACWLFYRANNSPISGALSGFLSLASDDGNDWSNSTFVTSQSASPTPIQNSQCSVFGGPTTLNGEGDTLTLTVTLTFAPSFAGDKNLYGRADAMTNYTQLGSFTATAGGSSGPDFSFGVLPVSPQTVNVPSSVDYGITLNGTNGYNGTVSFTVSGLPPDSTLTGLAPLTPGQKELFTVHTAESTPPGSYPITVTGSDGTLTHSQTITLNVTIEPIPSLTARPNSGSGAMQTFVFTAQGTQSSSGPNTAARALNVLFNTSIDGRAACWMYYDLNAPDSLTLASDDGTLWTSTTYTSGFSPSIGNSQCTLTNFIPVKGSPNSAFQVTITFSHAFAGAKNIFMRGVNYAGTDTGYTVQGLWTAP